MSFRHEVKAIIQKAKADREKYQRESQAFEASWIRLRDSTIERLFREAAQAFTEENIGTGRDNINGSTVLGAVSDPQRPNRFLHSLRFKADTKERTIICSSSLFSDESFTLDHFTEDVIQGKIMRFADLVARGDSPHPDSML